MAEEADKANERRFLVLGAVAAPVIPALLVGLSTLMANYNEASNQRLLSSAAANDAVCGVDAQGEVALVALGPFMIAAGDVNYFPHPSGADVGNDSIGLCYFTDKYGVRNLALAVPEAIALDSI